MVAWVTLGTWRIPNHFIDRGGVQRKKGKGYVCTHTPHTHTYSPYYTHTTHTYIHTPHTYHPTHTPHHTLTHTPITHTHTQHTHQ